MKERRNPGAEDRHRHLDALVLQQRRYTILVVSAVAALMAISGAAAFFLYRPAKIDRDQLVSIVQTHLQATISPSAQLLFSEMRIEQMEGNQYKVSGSIDAVGAGTETGLFLYTVTVRHHPDGTWVPEQLELSRTR